MLFHNPVILARQFATLDIFSGGRAICGLGIGWSKDEYQASNIPFQQRDKRAGEFVQVLIKMWTEEIVEFKGKFYNIPASKIGPKPIQKPHIPIYLGGYATNTFTRIARYADGWLASVSGPIDLVDSSIKSLKTQLDKENKNSNQIKIITLIFPQLSEEKIDSNNKNSSSGTGQQQQQRSQRFPFSGTAEEIGKDIQKIKQMGVEHVIFGFTRLSLDKIIDTAKELRKFAI